METEMNRVILAGRLGRDPEGRETRSGVVVNLNLATRERKKEGDRWVDGVEWHRVVCFGKTAELAEKYLSKGRECIVEGRLRTSSWEKDGEKKYRTEVLADRGEFVGGKAEPRSSSSGGSFRDDDVPF
jgi:single-strand DNA-binding protein